MARQPIEMVVRIDREMPTALGIGVRRHTVDQRHPADLEQRLGGHFAQGAHAPAAPAASSTASVGNRSLIAAMKARRPAQVQKFAACAGLPRYEPRKQVVWSDAPERNRPSRAAFRDCERDRRPRPCSEVRRPLGPFDKDDCGGIVKKSELFGFSGRLQPVEIGMQ